MVLSSDRTRRPTFAGRGAVPGAEVLFLLLLFPVTSILLGFNLYHVSLVALLGLVAYRIVATEHLRVPHSLVVVLLLWAVFLLYAAVSMVWSPSSSYGMHKFARLLTICTVLIVVPALLFPDEGAVHRFFKLTVYVSIAVAVVIVLGFLSPAHSRPYYLLGTSNHLPTGRTMGFGVVVATYYVLSAETAGDRLVRGLMLGILLVGIVVSGSRGPFLATFASAGILVFLVFYVTRDEKERAFAFVAGAGLSIAVLFGLHFGLGVSVPTFDRIVPMVRGEFDTSNLRRLRIYRQAVLLWLQSPVFGGGIGSFGPWIHGSDMEEYPHNLVLELLAEFGLVGLLIFGALLAVALRDIVAVRREHPVWVLLLCLFIYALLNASFSQDLQGDRMIYAVIGLSTIFGLQTERSG